MTQPVSHRHAICIDRYAGPYERWVYSDELGRPYAFPAIAQHRSNRFTALLDGGCVSALTDIESVRVPPLWKPSATTRTIIPFVFEEGAADKTDLPDDVCISNCLHSLRNGVAQTLGDATRPPPRFRVNVPVAEGTWVDSYDPDGANSSWVKPKTRPKAIIAVIDDGLPFAHRAFLDTKGRSKINYCWLQSGMGQACAHVPFGREYTNGEINSLRHDFPNDETALYRKAGAINSDVTELGHHLRRNATHGAHVLGLAAGNDSLFPDHPIDDDIQIIAVQLPNTVAWDTSGFGKDMYMVSALHYVFERASRIAASFGCGELPLIVNFSYGWSAGRHDGGCEMEIAIRDLLSARQAVQPVTELVMPTGNNFGSDMHARYDETTFDDNQAHIHWHIQPADLTSSYLELWFPNGFDPTGYRLALEPPHGVRLDNSAEIDITADPDLADDGDPRRFVEVCLDGKIVGQLSADHHRRNRWRAMIAVIPTVYTRDQDRRLPSGPWTVSLSRTRCASALGEKDDILIYVQRDDDPSELKSNGRQSYLVPFDDSALRPPEKPRPPVQDIPEDIAQVAGYGALNAVASSAQTTRVAGFTGQTARISSYSGSGGLRKNGDGSVSAWGAQTDLAAMSDLSRALPGIPSIGVLSGAHARFVGTSCAAPSAARIMVCNAAAGRDVYHGFGDSLPLYPTETASDAVRVQHAARVGHRTAPPVTKRG